MEDPSKHSSDDVDGMNVCLMSGDEMRLHFTNSQRSLTPVIIIIITIIIFFIKIVL